jgi:AraC family transcriptional regulator
MDTLKQFNLAMEYIETHLTETIDFQLVAQLACCSEYHFRRMFASLAGLSLSDYIRRRRLSQAALELHKSDVRVVDLAARYGYGSSDAFSRAFQALHGITPSEARIAQVPLKTFPPMTFRLTLSGHRPIEYRIVEKAAFSIVGIHELIPLLYQGMNPEVVRMWERLSSTDIEALDALSDIDPCGLIDAVVLPCLDAQLEGTLIDYYIGVATTQTASSRWQVLPVSASTWGVFNVYGAFPQSLNDIWERVYSEWMVTAGYEVNTGPHMVWMQGEEMESSDFICELWIPITKGL